MLRLGRRKILVIVIAAFLALETAGAVAADTTTPQTPWYATWYLWLGLGLFIIVIVSLLGAKD